MYSEGLARLSAIITFLGFNLTFLPQFILGYMGMPRRYHVYAPELQVYSVLSSAGASILAIGCALPLGYFLWSLFFGKKAPSNTWRGEQPFEWQIQSPPILENFEIAPVSPKALQYSHEEIAHIDHSFRICGIISNHPNSKRTRPPWGCGCS